MAVTGDFQSTLEIRAHWCSQQVVTSSWTSIGRSWNPRRHVLGQRGGLESPYNLMGWCRCWYEKPHGCVFVMVVIVMFLLNPPWLSDGQLQLPSVGCSFWVLGTANDGYLMIMVELAAYPRPTPKMAPAVKWRWDMYAKPHTEWHPDLELNSTISQFYGANIY